MKKSQFKFWSCLILAIIIYSGFIVYYVQAQPNEPNNTIVVQKDTSKNTNNSIDAMAEKRTESILLNNASGEEKTVSLKNSDPEFFLSKMIEFYQQIIMLLITIIGIVLVINFYMSKWRAEDIARDALEGKSFAVLLEKLIGTHVAQSSDIAYIKEQLDRLDDIDIRLDDFGPRLEFLEKTITEESYNLSESNTLKEESNGGN